MTKPKDVSDVIPTGMNFEGLAGGGFRRDDFIPIVASKSPPPLQLNIQSIESFLNGGLGSISKLYVSEDLPDGIRKLFAGETDVVIDQAEQRYLFGTGRSSINFHRILANKVMAKRLAEATWIIYDTEGTQDGFKKSIEYFKDWVKRNENE